MDQVRRKTNATSAYQRHLTGKGVTVAFLDTGIGSAGQDPCFP